MFRDQVGEVSLEKPDPVLITRQYNDERIALIAALFAYGNARLIVKFLQTLDFSLLQKDDKIVIQSLQRHYYRFQTSRDIAEFFITLQRLESVSSLEALFLEGYRKEHNVMHGINALIAQFQRLNSYRSQGYDFLIGRLYKEKNESSTFKRWLMYLRWMVRKDHIDLGLWQKVQRSDLLMPLDTHTFEVSQKLGLLQRKSYDFKSVLLLTQKLKEFDPDDPIKYDFALYRLGQEKLI